MLLIIKLWFIWHKGLDKIEFLQSHENVEIYQKAFEIIERYFGTEDEESAIAPSVDENNQFAFGSAEDNFPDSTNNQNFQF